MSNSYLIKTKILSEDDENSSSSSLFKYLLESQTDDTIVPELNIITSNSKCYSNVLFELSKLENHFDAFYSFGGYLSAGILAEFGGVKDRLAFQCDNLLITDSKEQLGVYVEMSRSNRSKHTVINVSPTAETIEQTNLINIGYSRHNTPKQVHANMLNSNSVSIGEAKADMQLLEPLLRDAKFARINMDIIDSVIAGFSIFEVCTIMKYLGHANHLDLVLLDGDKTNDPRYYEKAALLTWYFLEGRQFRQNDYPQNPKNKTYLVHSSEMDFDFEFSKSELSGRWWMRKPKQDNEYVPISFEEYSNIVEDNVPKRILELM